MFSISIYTVLGAVLAACGIIYLVIFLIGDEMYHLVIRLICAVCLAIIPIWMMTMEEAQQYGYEKLLVVMFLGIINIAITAINLIEDY